MKSTDKKAHVNISLNPSISDIFDSLKPVHGYESLSGFVEEKILSLFQEIAPDVLMELEIKSTREKLAKLEGDYPAVKCAYQNFREIKKGEKGKTGEKEAFNMEDIREKAYQKHLSNLKFQITNNKPFDWPKLQEDLRFKNKFECMDYVENRLITEGLRS